MSDFRKALLWTAIPLVVLALLGLIPGFVASPIVGIIGVLAAFIVAIVLLVKQKRKAASGIFVGIAIAIVTLGATCFAWAG